jgi:hypothetical protein
LSTSAGKARKDIKSKCFFVEFRSHGQKVIKSKLRGFIFLTSCKASKQDFWDWFCRLLEPRPQSHQIETYGIDFVNARTSSNLNFWERFCGHLQPSPESH